MDFWGTVIVLFRRWYVTLTAFALTMGAALGVYSSIKTTYSSSAVLVLTIPPNGPAPNNEGKKGDLTNPLLNFDTGLNMSASIVVTALENPETAAELGVAPGGDPEYEVNNGNPNPESLTESPFVFITAKSANPTVPQQLVARVVERAREVLADHQRKLGAPNGTFITAEETVPPTPPIPQHGGKLRAAAVTMAMGLFVSLTAAFAVESFALRRSARRGTGERVTAVAVEPLALDGSPPVRS